MLKYFKKIFYRYIQSVGIHVCPTFYLVGVNAEVLGMGETELFEDKDSPGLMAANVIINSDASKYVK